MAASYTLYICIEHIEEEEGSCNGNLARPNQMQNRSQTKCTVSEQSVTQLQEGQHFEQRKNS